MPRDKVIEERIELRSWQALDRLTRRHTFSTSAWAVYAHNRFHLASQFEPQGFEDCRPLHGHWVGWISQPLRRKYGSAHHPNLVAKCVLISNTFRLMHKEQSDDNKTKEIRIMQDNEIWKVISHEGRTLDVTRTRAEAEESVALLEQFPEYGGRWP